MRHLILFALLICVGCADSVEPEITPDIQPVLGDWMSEDGTITLTIKEQSGSEYGNSVWADLVRDGFSTDSIDCYYKDHESFPFHASITCTGTDFGGMRIYDNFSYMEIQNRQGYLTDLRRSW